MPRRWSTEQRAAGIGCGLSGVVFFSGVLMCFLWAVASGQVLFLLLLPFWVMTVGYFGPYAAHSLFVVLEQTSAGFDRVVWPDEGFLDWFWKAGYLLGLIAVWLGLAAAVLVPTSDLLDEVTLVIVASGTVLVTLWLVFPISLLSSLSGPSRLLILRWYVLKRLGLCWRPWLVFQLISGLLLAGWGLLAYVALSGWELVLTSRLVLTPGVVDLVRIMSVVLLVPVLGLTTATFLLWYGRLLGRLAWMVGMIRPLEEDAEEEEGKEGPPAAGLAEAPEPAPTEVPTEAEAPQVYRVVDEPPPQPPAELPFRWEEGRLPPPAPPRSQWRDQPGWQGHRGPDRTDEREPFPASGVPPLLVAKVWLFPWYRSTLRAWFWLSLGLACMAFLVRLQLLYT